MRHMLAPAALTACLTVNVLSGAVHASPGLSGSSGNGVLTWYDAAGYGACGTQINAGAELFAAVPASYWTAPAHKNDPLCKQGVLITYGGKSIKVPVKDLCPGCAANQIDLSRRAFAAFADPGATPRLTGVSWQITPV